MKVKYKRNVRFETEDGWVVYIRQQSFKFYVSGFNKYQLDKNTEFVKYYDSFRGVKNFVKRNFDVDLVE